MSQELFEQQMIRSEQQHICPNTTPPTFMLGEFSHCEEKPGFSAFVGPIPEMVPPTLAMRVLKVGIREFQPEFAVIALSPSADIFGEPCYESLRRSSPNADDDVVTLSFSSAGMIGIGVWNRATAGLGRPIGKIEFEEDFAEELIETAAKF